MSNDLISRSALLKEAAADGAYGYVDAKQIADAPAVDAVPVVRCKDCRFLEMHSYRCDPDNKWPCCRILKRKVNESDFCSHGERKMVALEDIIDLDAQTAANNEAMRKVIAFMVGEKKEE